MNSIQHKIEHTIERKDLELLLAIASAGSLAAAAQRLSLAATVVSKRLAALEARVGSKLLHRTTRRVQLSAEGETFVALAAPVVESFEALEQALSERQGEARGLLRIASSPGFGRVWLAPVLGALQQQHPGLEVQLHLAEALPDLTSGRFDAAVWLWRPRGGSLITRKLAPNRRIVVAAPSYLQRRGTPMTPEDLAEHECLVARENNDSPALWRLQPLTPRGAAARTVKVSGALSCNHGEVVREWALRGHGLMLRSLWDVHEWMQRGLLVQVLPEWAMLDADVHLVLPPRDARLVLPRRVRLLQEHLVSAFEQVPWSAAAAAVNVSKPPPPPAKRRRR
jgi:LysR family transcriptional regulator, transcriptional activator for dmlA